MGLRGVKRKQSAGWMGAPRGLAPMVEGSARGRERTGTNAEGATTESGGSNAPDASGGLGRGVRDSPKGAPA
jgi:hypothetical protein